MPCLTNTNYVGDFDETLKNPMATVHKAGISLEKLQKKIMPYFL